MGAKVNSPGMHKQECHLTSQHKPINSLWYQLKRARLISLGMTPTSTPVSEQVAVDVLDVGVNGGSAGHTSWGHIGVSLRVDVLQSFPWHSRAEF